MTQQLTSPTNSIPNQNILRLNSSSCCIVSPESSSFGSSFKNNLLHFQEYKCLQKNILPSNLGKKIVPLMAPSTGLGKKKLTIQIDESYDTPNSQKDNQKVEQLENKQIIKNKLRLPQQNQRQSSYSFDQGILCQQSDNSNIISPTQNKNGEYFYEINKKYNELQQKYLNGQKMIQQLIDQSQVKNQKLKNLQQKCLYLQSQLQTKILQSESKNSKIQILQQKIRNKEHQNQKLKEQLQEMDGKQNDCRYSNIQIQERLKQKDMKMRELMKINEKLKNMSKDIMKQAKANEKKVRDLQKQLQNNLCIVTQENIHRMKESSLKIKDKQNYERYNGTSSHSHNHNNKQQRDSLHTQQNLNTTKERQLCLTLTQNSVMARKSLQRKKTVTANTTSVGQLTQIKKSKIGNSSSSNTILSKKLMHK